MRTLSLILILLASTAALAKDAVVHTPFSPAHETHGVVGVKVISLSMPAEPHQPFLMGAGLFGELPFYDHQLEVEASAAVLLSRGHYDVPLDVIVKIPFHLSAHADVFIGAGPAVAWTNHGTAFGGKASAGIYYWATHAIGFMVEADYTLMEQHRHGVHGLESAAGIAWRI